MLGVYIHIPFCERKCIYCAFSSFCDLKEKDRYLSALKDEIDNFDYKKLEKSENYIEKNENLQKIDTIYIGGGTPSLLARGELKGILDAVKDKFTLSENSEITIECNPNSLTEEKLKFYKELGINRLSIGVQSLRDEQLKFIGRLHTSKQALDSLRLATKYFDNVSCDFLIGLPKQDGDEFIEDLSKVIEIGVKHISSYMLQVEDNTPLAKLVKNHPFVLPDDDECVDIYQKTSKFLQKNGFLQYEISNFAKYGYESRHNLKYWSGESYVGFGLFAHSYVYGRRWANSNTFQGYYQGKLALQETLNKKQLIEEHIMLGLRCELGVDIKYLEKLGYIIENNQNYHDFLAKNIIFQKNNRIYLNPQYYGVSNYVIVKLLNE